MQTGFWQNAFAIGLLVAFYFVVQWLMDVI